MNETISGARVAGRPPARDQEPGEGRRGEQHRVGRAANAHDLLELLNPLGDAREFEPERLPIEFALRHQQAFASSQVVY